MVFARAYLTCSICSHLERDTSFDATEQLGEVYLSTFIVLNEYNLSILIVFSKTTGLTQLQVPRTISIFAYE